MNGLVGLLAAILNCGYADIDFLIKICDDFRVDISDVWGRSKEYECNPDMNTLIYTAYYMAVYEAYSEVFSDDSQYDEYWLWDNNISIYCNYIDSSCQIMDDGDYETVTDYEELVEAFIKIKNKIDKGLWKIMN
jgi:hypothetical protein